MSDDEPRPPAPLPPVSRMRHLAWGLAGFGIGFGAVAAGAVVAVGIGTLVRDAGVNPPPGPPGGLIIPIPEEVRVVLGLGSIIGPMVFTGVLAARRSRWWVGPAVGWLIGCGFGVFFFVSSPLREGLWFAIFEPVIWLAGGLAGGLLSAIRRRWKC